MINESLQSLQKRVINSSAQSTPGSFNHNDEMGCLNEVRDCLLAKDDQQNTNVGPAGGYLKIKAN